MNVKFINFDFQYLITFQKVCYVKSVVDSLPTTNQGISKFTLDILVLTVGLSDPTF